MPLISRSPLHSPGLLRLYLRLDQELQPITQAGQTAIVQHALNRLTMNYSRTYLLAVLHLLHGFRVERAAVNMLRLAAPSVLQLAYLCFKNGGVLEPVAFGPNVTFNLLQACSLAKGLLPALWHKHPKFTLTSSRATTVWLEQQPATLAAIRSSFLSPGFSWFLWDVVGSGTAGLHQKHKGASPACGVGVPGDHVAHASSRGAIVLETAEFMQVDNYLLDCLQFIHLTQPAEQVTRCLVSQEQQQQQEGEEEEEAAGVVSGSIPFREAGRETQGLASSSSGDDLNDSSSQRDQEGSGSGAVTTSSSSAGGRISCLGSSGRCDKGSEDRGGSSGSSDGIHVVSSSKSTTFYAAAEGGSGRGCGISGVGIEYNGRQCVQAGRVADNNHGPSVEWLLLAAGSCSCVSSSRGAADTQAAAAAVDPAAAVGAGAVKDGEREQGLASPAEQGLGSVCGPGAAGPARAARAAGAAGPTGAAAARGPRRAGAPAAAESLAATGGGAAAGSLGSAVGVNAPQLKLLLELLLLMWPCPQNQLYRMMGTLDAAAIMSAHDWLLLLAALFQQASSAAKLQLLEERGTLLLQLLYEVMLDEDSGRSRHAEENSSVYTRTIAAYSSKHAGVLLKELAAAVWRGLGDEDSRSMGFPAGSSSSSSSVRAGTAKPVGLALLVLQSLLYEAVPLSVVEEVPLLPGGMLSIGEWMRYPSETHKQ